MKKYYHHQHHHYEIHIHRPQYKIVHKIPFIPKIIHVKIMFWLNLIILNRNKKKPPAPPRPLTYSQDLKKK